MTDRQLECDYLNARKFADSIDKYRLNEGVDALRQLDYFSRQMREYGLNPESKEHCELAKQSLEERIKAAGNEMIVRPSEELSEFGNNSNFRSLYENECWHIQLKLIELYKKLKSNKRIKSFSKKVQEVEGERFYVEIIYDKSLRIYNRDKECKWHKKECIHALPDIRISTSYWWSGIKVYGKNCEHISDNQWRDFMEETKRAYSFYFENPTISPNALNKFGYYFDHFRRFPEILREAFDGNGLIEIKNYVAKNIIEKKEF